MVYLTLAPMGKDILKLANRLGQVSESKRLHITTAESCTGGGIAAAITEVPGSSNWFEYGFVTYANRAKMDLLGVTAESLQRFGAVSREVVEQMAAGALAAAGADLAVAASGIAGPDGGSADKPVGTVWLAWAHRGAYPRAQQYLFQGNRGEIRAQAVEAALAGLIAMAESDKPPSLNSTV